MNNKKNNKNYYTGKGSVKDLPISAIVFSGKVKFWKLAKSTFIFSAAPALILIMFYVYGQLSYHQAIYLFSSIFFVALMFNYPYIADLQEITNYVGELVANKNPDEPELSFINNVEELSTSIQKLNRSWQDKNDALKILLLEDEILINSLPNILLMLDSNMKFIQTNEAAKNTFGWNYEEIINQVISSEKTISLCQKVMETGEGANLKYEINEPYYFFNIRAEKFPINSPNKIAIVLILQNLTDEKKNEKMLNDFVANASHEMKTPLASIVGFIETLAEVKNDPDAEKEFLKIMKEQSERMNRLINDLLMLSIIEANANRDKYENLQLPQIFSESISNLGTQIKTSHVQITTEIEDGLPTVYGNRDEMVRVFDNLISNAIKYSDDNGKVIVKFFTADNNIIKLPDYELNQKLVGFSLRDFGEGIDSKYIPRLTERFFRIDKARTRASGGTGLGLAIVQQIVDNHNGYLDIKSELGNGSIFSVFFPIK